MTTAIDLLLNRNSAAKLGLPAPNNDEWLQIQQAALRAPDHAGLKPWRFLLLQGDDLVKLGQLFVEVAVQQNPAMDQDEQQKLAAMPLRAPAMVITITQLEEHPKAPEIEQHASAACAAFSVLLAAEALGYAGIWRTGPMAFDRALMDKIGLADNEQITGFLYLGSREGRAKTVAQLDVQDYWRSGL